MLQMPHTMDLKINISVATVMSVAAAELLSMLLYNERTRWGRWAHHRYWVAALVSDVGLSFMLQWIIRDYWSVRKWEDAAMLSTWVGLIYASLDAPHIVHDHHSAMHFLYNVVHKVLLVFVMVVCLHHFRDYWWIRQVFWWW